MNKILDLSVFKDSTLDITMPDGALLRIPKPSQKMVIKVLQLKNIDTNADADTVIGALNSIVGDILNSNIKHVVFEEEYIENMNFEMKMAIVTAYTEFLTEVQNNPN